jgi:8-oxo-dGTP diphosphatase
MRPFVTDAVIVREGKIVLIRRNNEPFQGMWALPGGFTEEGETAEQCCEREAREETGLRVKAKRLVGVFSDPKRDPRGTISGAYICEVIGGELKGGDDAEEAKWFPLDGLPKLVFDHEKIIEEVKKLMK